MSVVFYSFLLVAAAEMGDKTQLLAFILATRFKKPWAIMSGIFVATVLNHLLAATLGNWVSDAVSKNILKWILGSIFIFFAVWILIPDKDKTGQKESRLGAFLTTTLTFFLAEMGDKTQLATVALAAKYQSVILVTIGTTLGMMASDGLAVVFGEKITEKIPMKWVRRLTAVLFGIFGFAILVS